MSLSFHDQLRKSFLIVRAAFAGLAIASIGFTTASAQQTYFQPEASMRAEYNSNRNLATDSQLEDEIAGYRGELSGTWGYLTETGGTIIRPRIRFLRYQDRDELQRTEQFLDIRTTRNTQKSQFSLAGKYSRRDAFTSELASAEFDDLDPDDPTTPESGVVVGGTKRTRFQLRPEFLYRYSERSGFGIRLQWQTSRFDDQLRDRLIDFDFVLGGFSFSHDISPRTTIELNPYASRYESGDNTNETNGTGIEIAWNRALTDRYNLRLSVIAERSDIEIRDDLTGVLLQSDKSSDYGPDLSLVRDGEISRLRLGIGREFTPTNRGSKSVTDQARIQYERNLRERLRLTTAVRYFRARSQGDIANASGRNYDYANGVIALEWAMARTWFLSGGYSYYLRDDEGDPDSANNDSFFLEIRYRGLGPQR